MAGYTYTLGEAAVHTFTNLSTRQRTCLLRVFDSLARLPHQEGDYREAGTSRRLYEVKLIDETLITWWTDHAAKEVCIVRIEPVE